MEKEKIAVGVVEKIAAPSTLRLQLTGVGGHAGATLMPGRRDALLAGAEIALAVEETALRSGSPDMVGTTGVFKIEPGAVNSIPFRALLEIDLRDTDAVARNAALAKIEKQAREICARRKVAIRVKRLNVDPPAICDAALSMSRRSSGVSSMASAPLFSARRAGFVVPGMGTIHGFWERSQASAI